MSNVRITKRIVDDSDPRERRYTLFDSNIRGFGLRVHPSGKKTWVFEYRPGEGGRAVNKKRITIGPSTDFTPDQARKHAEMYWAKVKVGQDPQGEKVEQRSALSFKQVADLFLDDHVRPKNAAKTVEQYQSILTRFLLPKFGAAKAKDVRNSDINKLHVSLKDKPFQANRMLAVLSSMYSFASGFGYVPEGYNPAKGIKKYPEPHRERLLSSSELERLGAAIRKAETVGIDWEIDNLNRSKHLPKGPLRTVISEHACATIRLLLFTGCRLREILRLRWEQVDLERGLLLLPSSKTGQKPVILNAASIAVLSSVTRIGDYVIAGKYAGLPEEKARSDLKRPWAVVASEAGLENVRLNDLRHNFATFGVSGGMGLPIVGKLLGQSQASTTQRYAHLQTDPLRKASDDIGDLVRKAIGEDANDKAGS